MTLVSLAAGWLLYRLVEPARAREGVEFAARPPEDAAQALYFAQTPVMRPTVPGSHRGRVGDHR